jgi:hypothetical protein
MKITKKDVLNNIDTIKKYIEELENPKLKLEDHNFRINSVGWKMGRTSIEGLRVLVNPEGDIWEYLDGEFKGEQLFTFSAMMRETKKRNKRVPTDEQFFKIANTKEDIKNLLLSGHRNITGYFNNLGTRAFFWSSSESGTNAWYRYLASSEARVYRYTNNKTNGFSVRCLKD